MIPLVLKWMVDGPVADQDHGGVWLGALCLLLLGIAEALLFGLRRWLVARPLTRVRSWSSFPMASRKELVAHLWANAINGHLRGDALDDTITNCARSPD